jgi:hypothetical protein
VANWREWERNAAAAFIAFASLCAYALYKRADFTDFANAIEWILGIFVAGHSAQQIAGAKAKGIPAGKAGAP